MSCVEDAACWQDPRTRTAQNVISVCRTGHGVFFLSYALLLMIIIIMVWLTQNGSIGGTVNAWVDTFICVIVIILMGVHWYKYVKGVIPECCTSEGNCGLGQSTAASGSGSGFSVSITSP